jgi:hypothetical protein
MTVSLGSAMNCCISCVRLGGLSGPSYANGVHPSEPSHSVHHYVSFGLLPAFRDGIFRMSRGK